jgi:cell division inhibitor SepF
MGVMDKFKDWFFDDKDNEIEDVEEESEEYKNDKPKKSNKSSSKKSYNDYPIPEEEEDNTEVEVETPTPTPPPPPVRETREDNTNSQVRHDSRNDMRGRSRTPNNTNLGKIKVDAVLEVVLVKPEVYTDAKQVADHLMNGKTVVINLENSTPETKRRILDFLTGVAYANKGAIKSVASLTYIITPHNVGFTGDDLVGELENNGVMLS